MRPFKLPAGALCRVAFSALLAFFFKNLLEPIPNHFSFWNIPKHPGICVIGEGQCLEGEIS